eukprot:jgi/Antlo1/478/705
MFCYTVDCTTKSPGGFLVQSCKTLNTKNLYYGKTDLTCLNCVCF